MGSGGKTLLLVCHYAALFLISNKLIFPKPSLFCCWLIGEGSPCPYLNPQDFSPRFLPCRGSSMPDEKEALADQISEIRYFAWWSAWRKLAGTLAYQWRGHSSYICKGLTCSSSEGSTLHRRRVWLDIKKQLLPRPWGKCLASHKAQFMSPARCWVSKLQGLCCANDTKPVCVCGGAESHRPGNTQVVRRK